jgi:hypothetical protein
MATSKKKEKKPIKTSTTNGHVANLKQSILEIFDIYGPSSSTVANVFTNKLWSSVSSFGWDNSHFSFY